MRIEVVTNCSKNQFGFRNCVHTSWSFDTLDGDIVHLYRNNIIVESEKLKAGQISWQTNFQINWRLVDETMDEIVSAVIVRSHKERIIIQGSGSLKLAVNWMFDMRQSIGEKDFRDLVIPGSHNSCAVVGGTFCDSLLRGYFVCQTLNTFQLGLLGNRFWDVRIKHESDGYFYLIHGSCVLDRLEALLIELLKLLLISKDVFMLDFHESREGFNNDKIYCKLFDTIEFFFHSQIAPADEIKTLNQAIYLNKRVIISFSDKIMFDVVQQIPQWSYGPVEHCWADSVDFLQIEVYMKKHLKYHLYSKDRKAVCLQSTRGYLQGMFTSLDDYAWLNAKCSISFLKSVARYKPNVVILDFIESTTLIETSILLNRMIL